MSDPPVVLTPEQMERMMDSITRRMAEMRSAREEEEKKDLSEEEEEDEQESGAPSVEDGFEDGFTDETRTPHYLHPQALREVRDGNMEAVRARVAADPQIVSKHHYYSHELLGHRAAFCGHRDIFRYLLSQDARADDQDADRENALHYACRGGQCEMVVELIDVHKLDPFYIGHCGSALDVAVESGSCELVFDILIGKYQMDPVRHVQRGVGCENVLVKAAARGHTELAVRLGKQYPELRDYFALFWAVRNGHQDTFMRLMSEVFGDDDRARVALYNLLMRI